MPNSPAVVNGVIFRQLFDGASSTYTFLVACPHTKEGILIDPVYEQVWPSTAQREESSDTGGPTIASRSVPAYCQHRLAVDSLGIIVADACRLSVTWRSLMTWV